MFGLLGSEVQDVWQQINWISIKTAFTLSRTSMSDFISFDCST